NPLNLSAFDLDNRVGVARKDLGPAGLEGDSIVVAFVATPSAASRPNPAAAGSPLLFSAAQGLWTAQVDFEKQLVAPNALVEHVKSPLPVVQVGDTVGGQVVTGLLLYDPIALA